MKGKRRRRGGKTILKGGRGWTLPAQLGQLRTEQGRKALLQIHLWCPDDLPRLWDRIDRTDVLVPVISKSREVPTSPLTICLLEMSEKEHSSFIFIWNF